MSAPLKETHGFPDGNRRFPSPEAARRLPTGERGRASIHSQPSVGRSGSLAFVLALLAFTPAQAQVAFRYFYDANGQLVRAVDSSGNVLEYDYDANGNSRANPALLGDSRLTGYL